MMREFTRQFWAMGSDVELRIWHENEQRARRALTYTERLFVQTESRLSRFRPNSELSRLNRSAGQPFKASQMLYAIVKLALDWRARTGGIFDPTILNDLVAWGYDRPFLDIQAEQQALADSGATAARVPTPAMQTSADGNRRNPSSIDIKLDLKGQITLPPGIGLDLGGIAKGWTAQRAAQRLGVLGPALLDAGADDYLVKPFAFRELLARLRALRRRNSGQRTTRLQVGDLTLDLVTHQASRNGQVIDLTAKEFALLELLMRHPNQVLSRTVIAEHVWDYDFYSQSNIVDVYIRYLRKKLDDPFDVKLIQTVRGAGYRLVDVNHA